LPADGRRQELMAEADAKIRPTKIDDKSPDRGFLVRQPRILVFLPDVLRTTHDHHQIVDRNVGDCLAGIEFDRIPSQAIGFEEVSENPRMIDIHMLQNENLHRASPRQGSKAPDVNQLAAIQ
jgi:hypothetical protein